MKYKIIVDTDSENYDPVQWENIVSADRMAKTLSDIKEKIRYNIKYFHDNPDKSKEYNEGYLDGIKAVKQLILDEMIDNGLNYF